MRKQHWEGNQWPCVDFDPYEAMDFLKVLTHLCQTFTLDMPDVVETLDGYIADLEIAGEPVALLLDIWTFSLATPSTTLRDNIFDALEALMT
jgi:hypothetical protein